MKLLRRLVFPLLCLLATPVFAATHPTLSTSTFTAVSINGRMNVMIQSAQNKGDRDLIHYPHQLISAKICGHTLYLRSLNTQKNPSVTLRLHALNQLTVNGPSAVTGSAVESDGLELYTNSNAVVNLNGTIKVKKISHRGYGRIQLRWVTADQLSITSSGGLIKLAGTAKNADIKLSNHAQLDAQYLRVRQMMVQTRGHAVAKVLATYSLQAFATQNSQIYFYKTPRHLSRYSRESGNILQLGSRN